MTAAQSGFPAGDWAAGAGPLAVLPTPRRHSGGAKMDLPTFFFPRVFFFPRSIPEFEGSFARTDA